MGQSVDKRGLAGLLWRCTGFCRMHARAEVRTLHQPPSPLIPRLTDPLQRISTLLNTEPCNTVYKECEVQLTNWVYSNTYCMT